MSTLFYAVSSFWLIIHAIYRFWLNRPHRRASGILPSSGSTRRRGLGSNIKLTLQHVYLRIDLTTFNDAHDRLATTFAQTRRAVWKRVALAFYNLGSISGALGTCVAVYLVFSTATWSLQMLGAATSSPSQSNGPLRKRDIGVQDANPHIGQDTFRDAPVQLIVHISYSLTRRTLYTEYIESLISDTWCNTTSISSAHSSYCSFRMSSNPRSRTRDYRRHVCTSLYQYWFH